MNSISRKVAGITANEHIKCYNTCKLSLENISSRQGLIKCTSTFHNQHRCYATRITLDQKKKSYYDLLGITPKATQAQVKDAYYKMSKTYHPDQYRGKDDPSVKFREITEAYEVLGNYQKRKMYDKGFLNLSTAATPPEAEEYSVKFYESRRQKSRAPSSTGKTPIYNFDDWSKFHYETSRERRANTKERYKEHLKNQTVVAEQKKTESVIGGLMLLMMFITFNFAMTPGSDKATTKKHK